MIKKALALSFQLGLLLTLNAQKLTPEQYIALYKDIAVKEMKRMGVPAAITLAQGLHESENGNSILVKKSNNHFGIKCKNTWSGNGVSHDDDALGECFRTYKTAEESYRDHSNFLRGSSRYSFLFNLNPSDYKGWAHGLKKAGYATNPKYPAIIIQNIERYNLQQFTMEAIGDVPVYNSSQFEDDKEVSFVYTEDSAVTNSSVPVFSNGDKTGYINQIKCVFAPAGTSLLALATRHNIDLSRLMQYNDMLKEGILIKDQPIFLERKAIEGDKDFCIAQKDETLHNIAQKHGLQLVYLAGYNKLTPNTVLSEGEIIYLKPQNFQAGANLSKQPAKETPASAKYHVVQAKEGLFSIARKYGITVQQLREWNSLTTDNLQIGQQIIISK